MPPKFSLELSEATVFAKGLDFQRRTSPCEAACPAGMPIQKMNAFIKENRMEEALQFMRSRNPLSSVTGRVCGHPCEEGCNRNEFDQGLSIRALERYPSDHADRTALSRPRKKEPTGKKVAVIGSGPAGMTCAWFSALLGHQVTVFDDQGIRIVVDEQGKLALRECPGTAEQHVVKYDEMMNLDSFEKKNRHEPVRLPLSKTTTCFEEFDQGLGRDDALAEAERCFHCGHCQLCGNCVEDCPGYVLAMTDNGPKVVYPEECWHCGNCRISCPSAAVSYEFPISMLV